MPHCRVDRCCHSYLSFSVPSVPPLCILPALLLFLLLFILKISVQLRIYLSTPTPFVSVLSDFYPRYYSDLIHRGAKNVSPNPNPYEITFHPFPLPSSVCRPCYLCSTHPQVDCHPPDFTGLEFCIIHISRGCCNFTWCECNK